MDLQCDNSHNPDSSKNVSESKNAATNVEASENSVTFQSALKDDKPLLSLTRECSSSQQQLEDKFKSLELKNDQCADVLKVCYSGRLIVEISKDKAINESGYFKSNVNPFLEDVNQKCVEVNFDVSDKMFKQVMRFIESGEITLDHENLFDIVKLAEYLQVDTLNEKCLACFTCNLNIKNIDAQLCLIEKHLVSDKKFKDNAMSFKSTYRPSYGGLFFVKKRNGRLLLANVFNKSCNMTIIKDDSFNYFSVEGCKLHYFCNFLIICIQSRFSFCLLSYDLLKDEFKDIEVESCQNTIVTSNSKNLFFIGVNKSGNKDAIQLSTFNKSINGELKRSKTRNFDLAELKQYSKIELHFSHCYDKNLYIYCTLLDSSTKVKEVYILIFSLDTLKVVDKKKLLDEQKTSDLDWKNYNRQYSEFKRYLLDIDAIFRLVYSEKHSILFIFSPFLKITIVYDLKNDSYSLQETIKTQYDDISGCYLTMKNDMLYLVESILVEYQRKVDIWKERVSNFQYENQSFGNCEEMYKGVSVVVDDNDSDSDSDEDCYRTGMIFLPMVDTPRLLAAIFV